jgi:hypothetical protein
LGVQVPPDAFFYRYIVRAEPVIPNSPDFLLEWSMLAEEPPFQDKQRFKKVHERRGHIYEGQYAPMPSTEPEWIDENTWGRREDSQGRKQHPWVDPHDPEDKLKYNLPYIPGHVVNAEGTANPKADKSAPNTTDMNRAPSDNNNVVRQPAGVVAPPPLQNLKDEEVPLKDRRDSPEKKPPSEPQLEVKEQRDEQIPERTGPTPEQIEEIRKKAAEEARLKAEEEAKIRAGLEAQKRADEAETAKKEKEQQGDLFFSYSNSFY